MSTRNLVPGDFGLGIIIPLSKDKTGDIANLSNYRVITLIPVVSKLCKCVLLNLCYDILVSDQLQFGFKKATGCSNAIHWFRSTVKFYNCKGSTVYTATLDISKAFDMINHYKLFDSLIKAGIPGWIIDILVNWYSKLTVKVRWNGNPSHSSIVQSGVRQDSCYRFLYLMYL